MFESAVLCGRIHLGKQGENHARRIPFELGLWENQFGEGRCELLHQRNGDDVPYPVTLTIENNVAYWCVTDVDTAFAGEGRCELRYIVNDVLVKSTTFITSVNESLGEGSAEPPEAYKPWVDQVLDAAEDVKNATTHQPIIGENGNWFTWDAENNTYVDTGVSASSGGGMTEGDVKKLLEDTAPKDHTHDVAKHTRINNANFEGRTTIINGSNAGASFTPTTLLSSGTVRSTFEIKCEGNVYISFASSDIASFYADGVNVISQVVEVEGISGLLYWKGKVNEYIRIGLSRNGRLSLNNFDMDEYTEGFMTGEDKQKLENTPTRTEVNNLINEAFGTVEAVFDEVHEYAESLGGDEA